MDRLSRAWTLIRIGRVADTLVVFAASLIGAELADLPDLSTTRLLLVASSNAMLFSASVIFNDWHDVEEDATNKPDRVIVSGKLSPTAALTESLVLFALGTLLAALAGTPFAAIAPLIVIASLSYTLWLKGVPFLGNTLVALISTYALGCWLLVAPPDSTYVAIAIGCVAFRIGGEIVKTSEDERGDRAAGIRTVATTRGVTFANRTGVAFLSLGLVAAAIPVVLRETSLVYHAALSVSIFLAALAWFQTLSLSRGQHHSGGRLVVIERMVTVLMIIGIGLGVSSAPS